MSIVKCHESHYVGVLDNPLNSWKNRRASSELLYKSNRPQVSMVNRHDKPLGMLEEPSKNSSRVLPTSRVVYQPTNHRNLWSIA